MWKNTALSPNVLKIGARLFWSQIWYRPKNTANLAQNDPGVWENQRDSNKNMKKVSVFAFVLK